MNDALKTFLIALVTAVVVHVLLTPYILRFHGYGPPGTLTTVSGPLEGKVPAPVAAPVVQPPAAPKLFAPDLDGMTLEEARNRFRAKGISIVEEGERAQPGVVPGTILTQRPRGGEALETMEIRVTVAKAGEHVRVPDVVDKTEEDARALLVQAGFEVPESEREASDEPPGVVIRQSPNPGATSQSGALVRLTIATSEVEVPKLRGKLLKQARDALEDAGLKVGPIKRREHPELGENRVLSQEPAAGDRAEVGSEVSLVIVAPN